MSDRTPRRKRLKRAAARLRRAVDDAVELNTDWVCVAMPLSDANLILKSIRSDLCR